MNSLRIRYINLCVLIKFERRWLRGGSALKFVLGDILQTKMNADAVVGEGVRSDDGLRHQH